MNITAPPMVKRIVNAILHPSRMQCAVLWRIRKLFVTPVTIDGKLFYRYKQELYPDYLSHGNAMSFIKDLALTWCTGKGLDIGADQWPLPGAIPIQNTHDVNALNLHPFADGSLDFVFSSHCLEHIDDWESALKLWISKLRTDGILFLYLPHESMKLWNPCGPWVASGHRWKPTTQALLPFLEAGSMKVLEYNPGRDSYWSFHIVCKKGAA